MNALEWYEIYGFYLDECVEKGIEPMPFEEWLWNW